VAETAKISADAMRMEIARAGKRLASREKKKQERIDLAPADQLQRRANSKVPYDNVKSGRAEEYIIASLLMEPALIDHCAALTPEAFSVSLFSRVYRQILDQNRDGYHAAVGTLTDLNEDEMSHIVGIYQNMKTVNEAALRDCVNTILSEHRKANVSSDDDLLALQEKLKQRKGIKA